MSLLDDVSIVVTPNGYKAGELYAVVPVPTEGAEEVTDGDFPVGTTAWTEGAGWNISGGLASGVSASSFIYQNIGYSINTLYKFSFQLVSISSGGVMPTLNGGGDVSSDLITSIGFHTVYLLNPATNGNISILGSSFTGSIDNISVKEYTAADMDVTRATAATRVDEAGLVNYAEIIGSELVNCVNFDCADPAAVWNEGTGWSFSGGKAIYDGTGGTSPIAQSDVIEVGKQYKITIEVLSNEGSGSNTLFLGGTILSTGNLSVGTHTFFGSTNNTSVALTIYGRSGEVFEIGSFSVKEVTRDNVPRIDYSGGGCPHILAEPQRTNLIPYSEDLTNAFYNTQALETVTQSLTLSPDGVNYGYTITPNTSTSNHWFDYTYAQVTVTIGNEITYSVFLKPNGNDFIQIATSTGFNPKYQNFELTGNGIIGTGDVNGKTIEKIGNWYRISVTETSIGVNPRFLLIPSPTALATRNASFTGNGTDGVLGWGVQIEIGSFPTSYIPTSGSTVTRNQDIFTRDGIASLINSTEGVLFVEMAALSNEALYREISLSDGTTNNVVEIRYTPTANQLQFVVRNASAVQVATSITLSNALDFNKIAFSFKSNDYKMYVNGSEVGTDLSGTMPSGLNTLSLDWAGNNKLFGKVKQLQVYKTALTDTQLAALTS